MKQIGKIGRANKKANRKIAKMALEKGIYFCEVCAVLEDMGLLTWQCLQSHSNAHRHGRVEYRADLDKLWDYMQWVYACSPAHRFIDEYTNIREKVFTNLRGKDNIDI